MVKISSSFHSNGSIYTPWPSLEKIASKLEQIRESFAYFLYVIAFKNVHGDLKTMKFWHFPKAVGYSVNKTLKWLLPSAPGSVRHLIWAIATSRTSHNGSCIFGNIGISFCNKCLWIWSTKKQPSKMIADYSNEFYCIFRYNRKTHASMLVEKPAPGNTGPITSPGFIVTNSNCSLSREAKYVKERLHRERLTYEHNLKCWMRINGRLFEILKKL